MALGRFSYVTLDATGTLLRPKHSVAAVYVDFFMSIMPPLVIPIPRDVVSVKDFGRSFKSEMTRAPNFGLDAHSAKPWWGRVIVDAFPSNMQAHMQAHPKHATQLIDALYEHYGQGAAWEVFADVRPTLNALKEANVSVGIVSNFDDRLHGIVRDLELASAVDFVLTSWEHQSMKPHPSIFHEAARRLHCRPHELLHVGDDPTNDYCGSVAAGCSARLLCRNNNGTVDPSVPIEHVVTSLLDIVPSKERGRQTIAFHTILSQHASRKRRV
ncbi:hypothetical protein H257_01361 [Aphanomyces astaci]|uniref:Haloacid dehalogenase, type II n=1 Tax=Aphanomyces astaci TaxID=112090 RepID=W4HA21_APHAT|nr:hypothetical protein H257_01361 [Aphanomyces astaci]ETV87963.1 hypothetical protein H257_01361 [Aphanomyces astaci]|eukprot:XP_009822826.1 hypothetical protein H257_01361 [Aphanomyces astaci]